VRLRGSIQCPCPGSFPAWESRLSHVAAASGRAYGRSGAKHQAERRAELLTAICEELRVVCPARNGNVSDAVVEQVFGPQLGIYVDQHTVGGLSLAGMTCDRVAMIEAPMRRRIKLDYTVFWAARSLTRAASAALLASRNAVGADCRINAASISLTVLVLSATTSVSHTATRATFTFINKGERSLTKS
jgi:hypothetical protein